MTGQQVPAVQDDQCGDWSNAPSPLSLGAVFERLGDEIRSTLTGERGAQVGQSDEWQSLDAALPPNRDVSRSSDRARRAADVVMAGFLLLVLSPVIALLAIAIAVDDPGSPFFAHERIGRGGRLFRCWKLRTMRQGVTTELTSDADLWSAYVEDDFKIRAGDDTRITRIGRVLRATYLDELPQLWNVLTGEMSLIGPRPVVAQELAWYGPFVDEFLSVRPGVSGAWQLTNHVAYPQRTFVELAYIRTRSWKLDLEIVARTVWALVTRRDSELSSLVPSHQEDSGLSEHEQVEVALASYADA